MENSSYPYKASLINILPNGFLSIFGESKSIVNESISNVKPYDHTYHIKEKYQLLQKLRCKKASFNSPRQLFSEIPYVTSKIVKSISFAKRRINSKNSVNTKSMESLGTATPIRKNREVYRMNIKFLTLDKS